MRTMLPLNNLGKKLRDAARWSKSVRSYDPHSRRTRLRGPTSIQIQTVDRCNAACLMCPYSSHRTEASGHFMDDDLYHHIIEEVRAIGTARTICMMLQNEPLLDIKVPERVQFARKLLGPTVRIMTVTNGTPLTADMIGKLHASGIDGVSVSIDAIREDTYRKIRPGLDFQHVVRNTLSLIEHLGPRRVSISFLRQRDNEGEEIDFADYWQRLGVRVIFLELTNRSGALESFECIKKQRPDLWRKLVHPFLNRLVPACPLPFTSLNVLWDGRVITCVEDWALHETIGDLSKQLLGEIWNGEKINHYRHLLWEHQTKESLVCAGCSLANRFWNT
jgi:MoaA/NifB/PqqE/SkfB family radical SAM enzyme